MVFSASYVTREESLQGKREVKAETAKEWARNKGYHFYEASAKTGANVSESFKYLFEGMFNRTIDNRSKYVY